MPQPTARRWAPQAAGAQKCTPRPGCCRRGCRRSRRPRKTRTGAACCRCAWRGRGAYGVGGGRVQSLGCRLPVLPPPAFLTATCLHSLHRLHLCPWPALLSPPQEVCLDSGGDASAFMVAATRFANERCWGTLSCAAFVHPATQVGRQRRLGGWAAAGAVWREAHRPLRHCRASPRFTPGTRPLPVPVPAAPARRCVRRHAVGAALRRRGRQRALTHRLCHHSAGLGRVRLGGHAPGAGPAAASVAGYGAPALAPAQRLTSVPPAPPPSLQDIGSGNCFVHNTLLLDHPQKFVCYAPWRFHPTPFW